MRNKIRVWALQNENWPLCPGLSAILICVSCLFTCFLLYTGPICLFLPDLIHVFLAILWLCWPIFFLKSKGNGFIWWHADLTFLFFIWYDFLWHPQNKQAAQLSVSLRRWHVFVIVENQNSQSLAQSDSDYFDIGKYDLNGCWAEIKVLFLSGRMFKRKKNSTWLTSLARYINSWPKWKTTSVLIRKQCFQAEGPILFASLSRRGDEEGVGGESKATTQERLPCIPLATTLLLEGTDRSWGKLL